MANKQTLPNSTSHWLPISEALRLLLERARESEVPIDGDISFEAKAKIGLCDAMATLAVWARVEVADDQTGRPTGDKCERHEIEVPAGLNPNDLDWPLSKPLWPWKTKSKGEFEWRLRPLCLIEVSREDVACHLLDDLSLVSIPDQSAIDGDWQAFAKAKWTPTDRARKAIAKLPRDGFMSLSAATNLAAFGSRVAPSSGSTIELRARIQQAARALCDAAKLDDVLLTGLIRGKSGAEAEQISDSYFITPRCLAASPNTLCCDFDRLNSQPSRESRSDELIEWTNVRVGAASLIGWLKEEVSFQLLRERRRLHSRRLFDHPFWSAPTALCWANFHDPEYMTSRRFDDDDDQLPAHRPERFDLESKRRSAVAFVSSDSTSMREMLRALKNKQIVSPASADPPPDIPRLIQFRREDVIDAFPRAAAEQSSEAPLPETLDIPDTRASETPEEPDVSTGRKAGQPPKVQFLHRIAKTRMEEGKAKPTGNAEAKALARLAKSLLPAGAEMPNEKTIANALGSWKTAWEDEQSTKK
jgi:hypothetical protein